LGFTGELTDPAASTAQDALVYLRARLSIFTRYRVKIDTGQLACQRGCKELDRLMGVSFTARLVRRFIC